MIAMIEQMYPKVTHHQLAWAMTMMYIYQMINNFLKQLLSVKTPMAIGIPAVRAPLTVPDFAIILQELAAGCLLMVTTLPPTFFCYEWPPVQPLPALVQQPPPLPDAQGGGVGCLAGGGGEGGGMGGDR